MRRPTSRWTAGRPRSAPPMLIRKFEFADYSQTRDFLDRLAEVSEEMGYHPSLQFDRTQVSVNVSPLEETLGDLEVRFAKQATELAEQTQQAG
ncbi:4a-hydroxytetrahydrobiopterin dehydratase [Guyparkeria sp. SB14A]|uniref:4a-hydroxytetrahydrobiopterin dehydratase n=1 Tax=Guyparkeria sp. SB14A TaxID=2571147 RepID=UPI00249505FE|nr:4a-hydroxytetrahydrobiopterin dehydratase [Guyparkeria sp. SB14A]